MKLPNIRSLYGRIFTIFWLTQLLVLIAVLVLQHHDPRVPRDLPHYLKTKLNQMAVDISAQVETQSGQFQDQLNTLSEQRKNHRIKWFFTTENGTLLEKQPHYNDRPIRNFITLSDEISSPQQRLYGHRMLAGPFLIQAKEQRAFFYASIAWKKPLPFYIQLLDRPFQLLIVTMLISTPLLLWLAWAVTRPARRLQTATERVISGCFEMDAELEKGPSEFQRAGVSFNQMIAAINQMMSGQQRLLSDISHELRSPLTRLRMANALAVRKQGQSDELRRIDTEAERMEKMINELLSLSRMQIDSHIERDSYSIEFLWQTLLEDAQFEASQHGKVLSYNSLPDIQLIGNAPMLASALENVVRNAINYAKQDIHVCFGLLENTLLVTISDDGEGVPPDMLTDLFRPFFRVSTARERETGGSGLGLAITENALRQHQGHVSASINSSGGLTITLTFTLAF